MGIARLQRVASVELLYDVLLVVNEARCRGRRFLDPSAQCVVPKCHFLRWGVDCKEPVLHVPVVGSERARALVQPACLITVEVVGIGELRVLQEPIRCIVHLPGRQMR